MTLTVLTDSDVRTILLSLNQDDILDLQHNLAEALHDYSTGTEETTGCCSANQPQRIGIGKKNGQTTLFMPASTSTTTGVKIVSIVAPPIQPVTSRNSSISTVSTGTTVSSQPSTTSSQSTTPRGSLTLLDGYGLPFGFVNAEELTAFRTALAACLVFRKRKRVHSIVVFGAGKQAYWHIRLALMLRGSEIHHVNIINRSFEGASPLMQQIYKNDEWVDLRNANSKLRFSVLSAEYGEYTRLLKEHVRNADAIFMCTPSTSPLFPAEHLTNTEGRKKGRYISAIGSYKPHMVEIHPDVLRQAVASEHKNHHHRHAEKSSVIIVDSLEACLEEAGEIIQAGLGADQLVEIGELVMVKKAMMKEVDMGGEGETGLKNWLEGGNVIYKSVGLGLMDLCVGEDLVMFARKKGVGITIDDF
ncbi:hypothetical protein MMC14_000922 [Varicellaria rhodocarpa]|nr:hypothetical protein [Varicellaria rhodocarpa]